MSTPGNVPENATTNVQVFYFDLVSLLNLNHMLI